MMINKTFIKSFAVAGVGVFFTFGCDTGVDPGWPDQNVVYYNSFESVEDTTGWFGLGAAQFRMEAPPTGGRQSVFISGGCVVPHAYLDLPEMVDDRYLKIRCWGKNLSRGGSVSLQIVDDWSKQIGVGVIDSVWTRYESTDSLFCPAKSRVRLAMSSGGIIPSAMLVDEIAVIQVE